MKKYILAISGLTSAVVLATALTASAQMGIGNADVRVGNMMASTTVRAHVEARFDGSIPGRMMGTTTRANMMNNERNRSDREITARIDSLNKLLSRIDGLANISDSQKATFSSNIQAEISALTSLKASIDAETSTSTLRTDLQSITKSFRIYALVEPQIQITAAADRIITLAKNLNTVAVKIQSYLTTAQSNGTDVSAAVSALTDLSAKTADATTQANAAISEIVNLKPDQGATTTMQTNLSTLKDARSKIAAATKDLGAARKDIGQAAAVVRSGFNAAIGEPKDKDHITASTTITASSSRE